jgi:nucleotide-binding universal stress UspA family protein
MVSKVLCPLDFSTGSMQAMRTAVQLAARTNAELVLAHVWHIPSIAFTNEFTLSSGLIDDIETELQGELDAAVREAGTQLARPVTGRMLAGVPWVELVELLENEAFDLCVIGTHGRTGLARVLIGAVAEKVVRHAPCSVLAVRPDSDIRPFHHALVPTDFSASAGHALDVAVPLVEPNGRITLLHVLELAVRYPGRVIDVDLEKRAAAALDAVAKSDPRIVTALRSGWPGAAILDALDADPSIDLVVMGSHGRTGIKRALMGSAAEKTVRYARCPVLVAREAK